MIPEFQTYCRTLTNLTSEEVDQICAFAIPRSLHRGENLLQQGQVCRHKTFVIKGLLRSYGTAADGAEYILQFSSENNWILDPESYHLQTATKFNISAIERADVLQWNKEDFDRLLKDIPALDRYSQQLASRNNYNSRQRLFTTLSSTPEEKYEDFVRNNPELLPRIPLHMIAAYLGMSLKTLTRIRHAQLHR
ncbi:Crp/Fnr family transcriptional regulator [Chitinophaga silvisoli]|uniref:Crp/Fnr family transcriptional regulator n=1 Tax=Chitinophaga silvisoli TaxID=2291814 RepID=A0A3E1P4Q9_9BACT|nr:Crp/Fnr family transcriptional regulator [Chitinophaga silvisoli]RFM35176.1 Crp/Fnr family transcriptional regulator [Chitinophaga silvisoli]